MFDIIGGVGVLRDGMRRMGLEGVGVDTALERQIFITLKIRYNDEDSKNNVKSLVTHIKPPSWKNLCDIPISFCR